MNAVVEIDGQEMVNSDEHSSRNWWSRNTSRAHFRYLGL